MTETETFLREFFGPGNDFTLPPTWRSDERYTRVAPFVEDIASVPARPLFLPRRYNGLSYVYAKAFGAPMGRRLGEALAAFVGPTYGHFVSSPVQPRPGDPVETALDRLGQGPMWRIEVPQTHWPAAWQALHLLRTVWLDRPARASDDIVPVGRLLRDFRIALASGDEQLSALCLQRLTASGAFDAGNIAFLRVRRNDALGYPERALDGAEVDDLFRMKLPTRIREALLVAVHRRYLTHAAANGDADAARDVLLDHPQFSTLLTGPAQLGREEAQAALLALALAFPPSADLAALHAATQDVRDPWLLALHEHLPHPRVATSKITAVDVRDLIESGAYEAAWHAIETLPAGVVRDRLAVHCALNVADPVRSADLHQALTRGGTDYIHQVLNQPWQLEAWQRHIENIGLLGRAVPRDWLEFLDRVIAGEDLSSLTQTLDEMTRHWPTPAAADRDLAAKLAQIPLEPSAVSITLDALPLLLEPMQDGRAGESSGVAVSLILLSEDLNEAALVALTIALRSFLLAGPNAGRYREVVSSLSDVAPQLVQVRTIDRVLDIVDLLLVGPAVDEGTRVAVCNDLLTRIRGLARRLSPAQVVLAEELGQEARLSLTWPALTGLSPETPAQVAHRRVVLLYSLQERVLDRVQRALRQIAPGLTIHTSSEHDGSDRLRDQAQASDLVLLATRRATHAATGFIERWTTGVVVYVPGAGSASMLHAALEALTQPLDNQVRRC
ncbi:MAG TPA: protein DpdD [Micromonosporaceae bacterium]|nr:protein DpdD [Micromonosporaceae bacterium]